MISKDSGVVDESEFVDLGVMSMNEYDAIEDGDESCIGTLRKERAFSHPVMVAMESEEPEELEAAPINFDKEASILENDKANDTFEEIHPSETESRLDADEPVVVSHDDSSDPV
ncbi:hypothetical protein WICPIJ_006306 [Wickerhamomyces pijperi]|nr:hypothetical protein WICPIJ_006306 [Wickerhamomyces pijperi]